MRVLRSFCSAALLAVLTLCTQPSHATTQTAPPQAADSRHVVAPQRDPDAACTQCHKEQKDELHGKHAGAINPNTQLAVTCTNCHGKASLLHRNGVKDVVYPKLKCHPILQSRNVTLAFEINVLNWL